MKTIGKKCAVLLLAAVMLATTDFLHRSSGKCVNVKGNDCQQQGYY